MFLLSLTLILPSLSNLQDVHSVKVLAGCKPHPVMRKPVSQQAWNLLSGDKKVVCVQS